MGGLGPEGLDFLPEIRAKEPLSEEIDRLVDPNVGWVIVTPFGRIPCERTTGSGERRTPLARQMLTDPFGMSALSETSRVSEIAELMVEASSSLDGLVSSCTPMRKPQMLASKSRKPDPGFAVGL